MNEIPTRWPTATDHEITINLQRREIERLEAQNKDTAKNALQLSASVARENQDLRGKLEAASEKTNRQYIQIERLTAELAESRKDIERQRADYMKRINQGTVAINGLRRELAESLHDEEAADKISALRGDVERLEKELAKLRSQPTETPVIHTITLKVDADDYRDIMAEFEHRKGYDLPDADEGANDEGRMVGEIVRGLVEYRCLWSAEHPRPASSPHPVTASEPRRFQCERCGGMGRMLETDGSTCRDCNGSGFLGLMPVAASEPTEPRDAIPAGVWWDGEWFQFRGYGYHDKTELYKQWYPRRDEFPTAPPATEPQPTAATPELDVMGMIDRLAEYAQFDVEIDAQELAVEIKSAVRALEAAVTIEEQP